MTVRWNGFDAGILPGLKSEIDAALGPLPAVYQIVSGARDSAQQYALWLQGRDANGNIVNPDAIVTNAKGTDSAHVRRAAVDWVPIVNGNALWEPVTSPEWKAGIAAVRGRPALTSGADFQLANGATDPGHAELKNWRTLQPIVAAAEATGVAGGDGISASDDGDQLQSFDDTSPPLFSWLELNPVIAIAGAIVLGVVVVAVVRARRD